MMGLKRVMGNLEHTVAFFFTILSYFREMGIIIDIMNFFFFFNIFFLKFFIGVAFIYHVVLALGLQRSESVIHTHISILFFPFRLL